MLNEFIYRIAMFIAMGWSDSWSGNLYEFAELVERRDAIASMIRTGMDIACVGIIIVGVSIIVTISKKYISLQR